MLDLFKDLKIDEKKLHEKFCLLKKKLEITGEQDVLKDWIVGFEDRDNKIIKEFQTTFHSSFWEFYLYAVFKQAGFEIDFSKQRPDFIVEKPFKFYIEAVVSNIKKDGIQESQRTLDDVLTMLRPYWLIDDFDERLKESIIRYSSSITKKAAKYKSYSKDPFFDKNAPFLVALSGYEHVNYGNNYYHAMIALLYGLVYDKVNKNYIRQDSVLKGSTQKAIKIGLFLNKEMEHISAVIFSCTLTLGKLTSLSISQDKSTLKTNTVLCIKHDTDFPHYKAHIVSHEDPEDLSDGVFVFYNPYAINPLPKETFSKTNIVNVTFDVSSCSISMNGNSLPIVSRINLAGGEYFIKSNLWKIMNVFNPEIVISLARVCDVDMADDGKQYDVEFKDIHSNIMKYTLTLDEIKFSEYNIVLEGVYLVTARLADDGNIPDFQSDKFDIINSLRKIKCFTFGDGTIVSIEKIE